MKSFSVIFPKRQFLRRLSILSVGMLIGQGILIISTPIITRFYTPEDFGLFAVFGALGSIFGMIIGLRYELAIPLERDDRAAAALVSGIFLTGLMIGLVLTFLIWLGAADFVALFEMPELAVLLWLLPPCLIVSAAGGALSFWSIRQGTFRLNSANRIYHYGAQALGQLGFAPATGSGAGLVFGYVLGFFARFLHLLFSLPRADLDAFRRPSLREIFVVLRCYWRYPIFATSSSALQATANMLPAVLIAMLYGPATAGLYALAQRVIALPLRLLGETASHVFLGEIRSLDHAGVIQLFKSTAALFATLGLIGMLPLLWIAPPLFAFVFGETWYDAGVIVQLLLPLYLMRFVVTPVSHTLNVLERQDLHLLASVLNVLALGVSFAIGWWQVLEANVTIGLFSAIASLTFVFYITVAWQSLRRADWEALRRSN